MALIDDLFTRKGQTVSPINPAPPPIAPVNGRHSGDYARTALQSEAARIAALTEGSRNIDLNTAAYRMGQLVGAGLIDSETVTGQLAAAAQQCGLPDHEIRLVLRQDSTSALTQGIANPRYPQPAELSQPYTLADVPAAELQAVLQAAEAEHTTWWPVTLPEAMADTAQQPSPTHLIRDDGHGMFYSGRVNGLIGESESGKSWIALLAIVQAINQDQHILMLDFEDSPASIHRRMRQLGLTDDQLARFDYASPAEALGAAQSADLMAAIGRNYAVIVVDGVNAAMALLGWELNSNTDATLFITTVLRPLAATGACVITVDHVPKNSEQRGKGGIGAQAKRAMVDGCTLSVDVTTPFGKGQAGKLRLMVDKDRHGFVRGVCPDGKHAGFVHLESVDDNVRIHIAPPGNQVANWQPTTKMAEIVKALTDLEKPLTFRQIKQLVPGRDETIRTAVAALVRAGRVSVQPGPRGAILHHLTTTNDDDSPGHGEKSGMTGHDQ